MKSQKLLFVCLGNICRSPTAEAVAAHLIKQRDLPWVVDSAGTSGAHDGEMADPRSILHGERRGYDLTSISRAIRESDYYDFDWILAMDASNLEHLRQRCPDKTLLDKISLVTDYCSEFKVKGVPDPYYGGVDGFDHVLDILEDAIEGLIDKVQDRSDKI
ncbi:low molecular weight protein-tyrosine-phosphatase [Bdellovibrio bacteriovorus]|nr:low molecular weight protein-tyrosine-phosphatase [Bdellovibrio bacteriovorus]AHZ86868.1 phosphotyrosine protein phosphatase [Bdellovibrio bacteriovorus]BEV67309.1 Putative low molecular weight protein-tyrosine-phosphatase [Bdellovibrio bacteriovorus]